MAGDALDKPILETERLVFHPFTPDDFCVLADLHSDPQVQRYIGGRWTDEVIQGRLDSYVAEQARFGFSKWKAYLRDGRFVGRVGISFWDRTGEFEIGYTLARAAWGQGLATEGSRAVVARFFATTPHDRLHGFTDVQNLGSRRVLERIGMVFQGEEDLGFGGVSAVYRLDRPA